MTTHVALLMNQYKEDQDTRRNAILEMLVQYTQCSYDERSLLVSAPRRSGKTTSIAMFAAGHDKDVTIYSSCIRAASKILRLVDAYAKQLGLHVEAVDACCIKVGGHLVHSLVAKVGTTKGSASDVVILDEAAYIAPDFFLDTIKPWLGTDEKTLICVSTKTSDTNYYSNLFDMKLPNTDTLAFPHQLAIPCC